LEKSPAERYQYMREMVVDLRRGQRSRPLSAPGVEEAIAPLEGGVASPRQLVEALSPVPPKSKRGSTSDKGWFNIGVGIFAVAAIALGALGVYRWLRPHPQPIQEQANLTPVPFTALSGQATSPAFSPDGSRIAFAWNDDPAHETNGFDLYVKALGSETLLRLTQHPSEWISPAWSPDGTQIAFHRMDDAETGIYVVPALGGPERKLFSTRIPWSDLTPISWSPDGKWIAFADRLPPEEHSRIYLLSTETLETRRILISPNCDSEAGPAFSHNGEYLAYWCFRNHGEASIYSLSLPDGKPKMIAPLWARPTGLTWSADDKKLVYARWSGVSAAELVKSLWRMVL